MIPAMADSDDARLPTWPRSPPGARRSASTYLRPEAERPASTGGGVHHLALICADPERTIRFYQDLLGFPLVELFENRDYPGSSHFFFDIGNRNLLAFFDFPGPRSRAGARRARRRAARRDLGDARGVRSGEGAARPTPASSTVGPDLGVEESIYFKDPDNIQVELIRQPLFEMPESAPQDES